MQKRSARQGAFTSIRIRSCRPPLSKMWRLLMLSTLVLFTLLLSVAASHAEERRPGILAQGRKRGFEKEEADLHDEGEEDEEGGDEGESENPDQKDRDGLVGAKSRMILSNALQSPYREFGTPEEAKKHREMALRVRELLSRLPIIPLSQKPVLHKETLVAPAPSFAPGAPHDHLAAVPLPPGAIHTPAGLVFTDPATAVHAARMAVPHLEKNAIYTHDDVTDDHMQPVPRAAPVAPPLYGGRVPTQEMPAAFATGEEQYPVSEMPLSYLERADEAADTPASPEALPEKNYPQHYESRGELQVPEPHPFAAPAEFVQLFGIMNALSALVNWVSSMRNEIISADSDSRAAGGEDEEEKGREDDVTETGGRDNITNRHPDEDVTEDGHLGKREEKARASYRAFRAGLHPEN